MTNFRYRITFGKGPELRFTGHLDLHRAWERTFRRSGIELAYSQGFRPRARINIGAALPLGCTSGGDLLDVESTEAVAAADFIAALRSAAPPGLTLEATEEVDLGGPKLQKLIQSSKYQVVLGMDTPSDLASRIDGLVASESLPRTRKGKGYDLRPLIERLELTGESERPKLRMQLAARSGATGRPDEVLLALDLDPTSLVPHRTRLILSND